MRKKLLDLSGKIDSLTLELFDVVSNVASSLGIPFFIVGATARDVILKWGYGIQTMRATQDIDFGIQVEDWDRYEKFKIGLTATGNFEPDPKHRQRLEYKKIIKIDLIPFGAISSPDHAIVWPPDDSIKMNTLGFKESYEHSLTIRFRSSPVIDIKFASLAGLALLKIISWGDDRPGRNRDAKDLRLILRHYLDAGNDERLFEDELDIIEKLKEKGDFDYEKAGARLLGRDMAKMAIPDSRKRLIEILEQETGERTRYKLVEDMMNASRAYSSRFEENIDLLEELKAGILEGSQKGKIKKI